MGEPWKEGKTGFEGNKYIFCFDLVTLNSRKKENVQLKERKVKLQNTHTHTLPCYTKMIRCALNYSRIYKRSKWELERGDILCVAIRLQNEKDVLTQFCAPDNFGRTRQSQRKHSFTYKRKFICVIKHSILRKWVNTHYCYRTCSQCTLTCTFTHILLNTISYTFLPTFSITFCGHFWTHSFTHIACFFKILSTTHTFFKKCC